MMTYLLMAALVLAYALSILIGVKYRPDKENFFDVKDTTVLKAIFCIIVVLVHTPVGYRNPIQDMMGSFAYIGVTFFFMTSSFGLKWSVAHKPQYLRTFWRKRLPALLIPSCLCYLISVLLAIPAGYPTSSLVYVALHDWVKVLLLFYAVFWLFYWLPDKMTSIPALRSAGRCLAKYQDWLICLAVVLMSLFDRLTPVKLTFIWPTESVGFAYGILLANAYEKFKGWSNKNWHTKTLFLVLSSGLLGVAYLKYKQVDFLGDYCLKIVLGISLLLLILLIIRRFTFQNRVLTFVGGISYEVFLMHAPVLTILQSTGWVQNSGVFIWIVILTSIFLSAIVNRIAASILHVILPFLTRSGKFTQHRQH